MNSSIKAKRDVTDTSTKGPMAIGQQRTIFDPQSGRSWTLKRTNRAYAYDLADAYNEMLPFSSNLRWIVVGVPGNEQVKLVTRLEVIDAD